MTRLAIIGAGLAGLTAATGLQQSSNLRVDVRVFEKSWRAGGRMACRSKARDFDHGAQYFTVRSETFRAMLAPFIERGLVARWDAHLVELDRGAIARRRQWGAGHAHYVAVPGMNALCLAIAADLDVRYDTRVVSIDPAGSAWQLRDDKGADLGLFDRVITAIPAPQAAAIMPGCFSHRAELQQRKMRACYTLMLGFRQPQQTGFDAARVNNADIGWIAVNCSKPGRPPGFSLLVNSTTQWAANNIDMPDDSVKQHLMNELSDVTGLDLSLADHIDLHRWRYADIEKQAGAAALVDSENRLAAIGDWCIEGRVESAFTSANSLAMLWG